MPELIVNYFPEGTHPEAPRFLVPAFDGSGSG
jgi:hypothetical protein